MQVFVLLDYSELNQERIELKKLNILTLLEVTVVRAVSFATLRYYIMNMNN